ncbi:MAG: response regulator [Burkholderiaceae bacterium]
MTGGRLLVLDDDATVGQILIAGARTSGFEACLCATVPAFLEALLDWTPTHLAIDLTLPGSSGVEVLHRVAEAGSRARIIICSGSGRDELDAALKAARGLGLAAAGALSKPFRLAELRALLVAPA